MNVAHVLWIAKYLDYIDGCLEMESGLTCVRLMLVLCSFAVLLLFGECWEC